MKYKKGFTLVELLAVIVILAILMVSAGSAILTTMNKSKINTFKNEVLTFMDSAENMYSELSMDPGNYAKYVKESEDMQAVGICVTLPGLIENGYLEKDIKTYAGVIVIEVPYDGSTPNVMAWVHNSTYGINGIERKHINRLKFKKENNTKSLKRDEGGTITYAYHTSGGPLGIVTDLRGLKNVIKTAYGKNDANVIGIPSGLENGNNPISGGSAKSPVLEIKLYSERGGSNRLFKNMPCINTKLSNT